MDLAEIFRVMRRRWYVLVPGLLLTVALTVGAYVRVPVNYQSQSTVALLNSQKGTVAFDGNPFLSTQTSLTGMADILARNLNSDASVADLRAQGATGTTVAKIADNALGPLIWLTVTGTDKDAVLKSDQLLTRYAAKRLAQFQSSQSVYVAPSAMIRMTTIVPPQNPMPQTKTRTEYLALATLMGIVISMVATFYVDARKRGPAPAHRARAARRATPEPVTGGTTATGKDPGADPAADTDPGPEPDTGAGPDSAAADAGGAVSAPATDRQVPRAPWWSADHTDRTHTDHPHGTAGDGTQPIDGPGGTPGADAEATAQAETQTPRFV